MIRKELLIIISIWFIASNSYGQFNTLWGFAGTVKSPAGMSLGGFSQNKTFAIVNMRLSPMGMAKLMGIYTDRETYIKDDIFYHDSDYNYIDTGRELVRRFSMNVQIGKYIKPGLYWYFGIGGGMHLTSREYEEFYLGSYHDPAIVTIKDKSAIGVELEIGIARMIGESILLHAGLSTVNMMVWKVGVDPSFGILFISHNHSNRVRNLGKFSIKDK